MRNYFSKFQKIAKELFQVGLGQVVATLGGLLGVRLLTNMMTPSSYGELALGLTFLTLIQQLIMGPITNGFARYFVIAQEKEDVKSYLKAVWSLLVKSSLTTIGILFVVIFALLLTNNWVWIGLLFLSSLFTLVSSYNIALDNIQNAARQRVVVAWHQGLSQWLRFLFAVGFILLFGSSSSFAMLGYFVSAVIVLLSQWFFFQKNSLYKMQERWFGLNWNNPNIWESKIVQFALPFSTWGLFSWAQMSSDRWALQIFQSTASVGFYSVLYQLGYYPITILTGIFVQFISPLLYRRVGDAMELERVQSTQRFTNQLTIAALGLAGLAVFAMWMLQEIIFQILVAPEYHSVSYLLPWTALSGGLFAAGQISALTALNNNQPQKLLKPKIATSLLGVVLSFFGAYLYGLEGVVGASVLFSLIYFLWVYGLFRPQANVVNASDSQ
ncbi:MAG: lipopolysaccharide biosynthesis protein [Anaerolineales bacterium]|nr:lipopolysaccharide biosynthesis protein [Anaerolineales bacterium]